MVTVGQNGFDFFLKRWGFVFEFGQNTAFLIQIAIGEEGIEDVLRIFCIKPIDFGETVFLDPATRDAVFDHVGGNGQNSGDFFGDHI